MRKILLGATALFILLNQSAFAACSTEGTAPNPKATSGQHALVAGAGQTESATSTNSSWTAANVALYEWNPSTQQWVRAAAYQMPDYGNGYVTNGGANANSNGDAQLDIGGCSMNPPSGATQLGQIFVTAAPPSNSTWGAFRWVLIDAAGRVRTMWSDPQRRADCNAALNAIEYNQCSFEDMELSPPNGCGSGASQSVVPDGFVGLPTLGPIFGSSCNHHDRCYSTFRVSKLTCDLALGNEMRAACAETFNPNLPGWGTLTPDELSLLHSNCNAQAQAYETGLITDVFRSYLQALGSLGAFYSAVMPSSQSAFDAAQDNAKCAEAKQRRQQACGF